MKQIIIKIIPYIIIIFLLFVAFRQCDEKEKPEFHFNNDSLQKVNKIESKRADSLQILANRKDSIVEKEVIRYRYLKGKTDTLPCEEKLPLIINICDSIITVDSTEIKLLRSVIKLDSNVIANQKTIHHNDSIENKALKKEVRKQKNQKRLIIIGWGIREGIGLIK